MSLRLPFTSLVACCLAASLPGCGAVDPCGGQSGTCVGVVLTGSVGDIDGVHIDVAGAASHGFNSSLPAPGPLPVAVPLLLKEGVTGTLQLAAVGLLGGNTVALGTASVAIVAGGAARIEIPMTMVGGPTCSDRARDGSETDIDCGGSCPPCADGKLCGKGADCQSGACAAGRCVGSSCVDGITNGKESDQDCGGACPKACVDGKKCLAAADCVSGVCTAMKICAAPTCVDTVRNGAETDVDCGGGMGCEGCGANRSCIQGSDCRSLVCDASNKKCAAPSCMDTVKNGAEGDVDCGGNCSPCPDGKGCNNKMDCASGVCGASNTCAGAGCKDGVKNGKETDVDCGGGECAACADLKTCAMGSDCASKVCTTNICQKPACNDMLANGDETDLDCGGSCNACALGRMCRINKDCVTASCAAGVCAPTCMDNLVDGMETDVDCGGGMCNPCGLGRKCLLGRDCNSGVCGPNNLCVGATCNDKVKNGMETDVDCGGALCPRCKDALVCKTDADCISGYCKVGVCAPLFGVPKIQALVTPGRTLAVADLDGDKVSDVVVALPTSTAVQVFQSSDGSSTINMVGGATPQAVTVCDYTQDGFADVLIANIGGTVGIMAGNGKGGLGAARLVMWPAVPGLVACGNLTNGLPTIAATSTAAGLATMFDPGPPVPYMTSPAPRGMALADFDRNGTLDVAVAAMGAVDVFSNDGTGRLKRVQTLAVPSLCAEAVVAADLAGDGFPELIVNSSCQTNVDGFNNKAGVFQVNPVRIAVGNVATTEVLAADLNGDGKIDLAANGPNSTLSVVMGVGDGTFSLANNYDIGKVSPSTLRVGEFNKDNRVDIVGLQNSTGSFFYLLSAR